MQIKLIRTGGFIPITKEAAKQVDWIKEEMDDLLQKIKTEEGPGLKRDATTYHIMYDAGTFPIDWEKIPAKYKDIFEELKDNLAIVKR